MTTYLRARRASRSLSATEVAERVGVHPTSVLRWERGERLPGPTHIHRLARSLAVETADVAGFFDSLRPRATSLPETVRGHGLRPLRHAAGVPATRLAAKIGVPAASVYMAPVVVAGPRRVRRAATTCAGSSYLDTGRPAGGADRPPAVGRPHAGRGGSAAVVQYVVGEGLGEGTRDPGAGDAPAPGGALRSPRGSAPQRVSAWVKRHSMVER